MTFSMSLLYLDAMRVVGMLILFLAGLGFGALPTPASASPCPHHAQVAATAVNESRSEEAPVVLAAEVGVRVATDQAEAPPLSPLFDYAATAEQSCCPAAQVAVQAFGTAFAPNCRLADRLSLRGSIPPWAAPTTDIYRPPAFA